MDSPVAADVLDEPLPHEAAGLEAGSCAERLPAVASDASRYIL
jgi:hypothetical protein